MHPARMHCVQLSGIVLRKWTEMLFIAFTKVQRQVAAHPTAAPPQRPAVEVCAGRQQLLCQGRTHGTSHGTSTHLLPLKRLCMQPAAAAQAEAEDTATFTLEHCLQLMLQQAQHSAHRNGTTSAPCIPESVICELHVIMHRKW